MDKCVEYWKQVLDILEVNQNIGFDNKFIKGLKPVSMTDSVFTVRVIQYDFIKPLVEKKYKVYIEEALTFINGQSPMSLCILLKGEDTPPEEPVKEVVNKNTNYRLPNGLMPKYTFDNFIVGANNQMAHAAAMSVCKTPGTSSYNPLFLYGGVGLGKTHLMQAIGNEIYKKNPEAKILYVSCETFTNEVISAIKNHENESFRRKYREVDLLLLDDIQFIEDKKATQEEFFFTFNDLWQNGKQIVITSDRHPNNIKNLTDRLVSRLKGGLPIDIGYPNIETSIAILRSKTEAEGIKIEDEVLSYIAESVKSNIREMEGALNAVMNYAKLTNTYNKPISLDIAYEALRNTVTALKPEMTVEYIQSVVGNYYGFTSEDLCSKRKTKDLALARQIAMFFSRKFLSDESLANIGKKFGGKDHSTVIHGINLVEKRIEDDPEFNSQITDIEKLITNK